MSCRVLGPSGGADHAEPDRRAGGQAGARRLVGEYIPTKKNGMVKDHYARLGFTVMETTPDGGSRTIWTWRRSPLPKRSSM